MPDWFNVNWVDIGQLPPVHWVLGWGLWHTAPFVWIHGFLADHFHWAIDYLPWFMAAVLLFIPMGLWLAWYSVSPLRANAQNVKWDPDRCQYWRTGPQAGKPRLHPIDYRQAVTRRYSIPFVGIPLYLSAIFLWSLVLLYPGHASWQLCALLWLVTAPLRRTLSIATARRAYLFRNHGDQLDTTLMQDVRAYYITGLTLGRVDSDSYEPAFDSDSVWARAGNRVHRWLKLEAGRMLISFFYPRRWFGFLWMIIASLFWPVSSTLAPFYYIEVAEDYQSLVTPKWRFNRESKYDGGNVVRGEASWKDDAEPATSGPGTVARRR
jgi:hypothetical protein